MWGRTAESAMAKLRGDGVDERQLPLDRDTTERWAEAEGSDLDARLIGGEAQERGLGATRTTRSFYLLDPRHDRI